jgi:hypothetical protein
MIVYLQKEDLQKCRDAAYARVDERISRGKILPEKREDQFAFHNIGCMGEFAVCKHYDCKWTGKFFEGKSWDDRALDTEVGEVRATFRSETEGGMRFYPTDDRIGAPYIWVTLQRMSRNCVRAKIVGWAYHKGNLRDEWWRPDIGENGAWIVPRNHLRPMAKLPKII